MISLSQLHYKQAQKAREEVEKSQHHICLNQ